MSPKNKKKFGGDNYMITDNDTLDPIFHNVLLSHFTEFQESTVAACTQEEGLERAATLEAISSGVEDIVQEEQIYGEEQIT